MKTNIQFSRRSVAPTTRNALRALAASTACFALGIAVSNAQMPSPSAPPPPVTPPAAVQPPTVQPSPASSETLFKRIDIDGDGFISKAELEKADATLAKDFERYDTNKDGKLSFAEFDAMLKVMRG